MDEMGRFRWSGLFVSSKRSSPDRLTNFAFLRTASVVLRVPPPTPPFAQEFPFMQKLPSLVLILGTFSFAAVPVQFTAGSSAKADEINKNFAYLDSSKVELAAITPAAIHALPDSNGTGKGSFTIANNLTARGLVSTTLRVGVTTSSSGALASFKSSGLGWAQGAEIIPAADGISGLFFRTYNKATDSSVYIGRQPNGNFAIAFWGLSGMTGTTGGHIPFQISPAGVAKFGSSLTVGGTLTANGKVLASAAEITDLRVAGTLRTSPTEPWADYVFEPGYKAMALKDVETFAKANGHLPEVPSAAEVQKDGIDLAKMNAILLKKIEELTLHAVAQEKRMEAQQARMETLQSKLEALERK